MRLSGGSRESETEWLGGSGARGRAIPRLNCFSLSCLVLTLILPLRRGPTPYSPLESNFESAFLLAFLFLNSLILFEALA
jgi:hypothetical protein